MNELAALGLVSFGIVLTLAVLGGFVLWWFRGHRIDATGLRIVRSDSWNPPKYGWIDGPNPNLDPVKLTGPLGDGSYSARVSLDMETGDSERPPAVRQHGARTHGVDDGT